MQRTTGLHILANNTPSDPPKKSAPFCIILAQEQPFCRVERSSRCPPYIHRRILQHMMAKARLKYTGDACACFFSAHLTNEALTLTPLFLVPAQGLLSQVYEHQEGALLLDAGTFSRILHAFTLDQTRPCDPGCAAFTLDVQEPKADKDEELSSKVHAFINGDDSADDSAPGNSE